MMMFGKMVTWLSVSLIAGWFSSDLDIHIRFDQIDRLRGEARVLFEKNAIGRATKVSYEKDGTYRVDVTIQDDFKNAVTDACRFFIVDDPSEPATKAIEMIQVNREGNALKDGAVVKGVTRLSALMERMEDNMSRTVEDLKERFKAFSKDLKEAPQSEDIKKLQKDLDQLLEKMKRSGASFRDKVQKDLVPKLQEEIDKLRDRLRELDREKEAEPLQTKMDEIRNI